MKYIAMVVLALVSFSAYSEMVFFKGSETNITTTGNLLDEVRDKGITTNVVEISGLVISARSGGSDQKINVTNYSLGITTDGTNDVTDAFEPGESMIFSFDKPIWINLIDFNRFESNETFNVLVGGNEVITIGYNDLSNKHRGYFTTNLLVDADIEITFSVGAGDIGLDGIDLTVDGAGSSGIPVLSFNSITNGRAIVAATFNEEPIEKFVLQHRLDFSESNLWSTVSDPFNVSTNWPVETTNSTGFFRAIAP